MMILGIDSSTTVATVSIATEEKILGEYTIDDKNTHSQKLMPMIEELFEQLNLKTMDLDGIAVSKGPGSFTGLRIGIASAKALAYALDKKLIAVSSLEVMANNLKHFEGLVIPLMDARNSRVFAAVYSACNGRLEELMHEDAVELTELIQRLNGEVGKLIFLGDGSRVYREVLAAEFGERALFAPMHLNTPRAASLCELALAKYQAGEFEDYFTMKPEYLRESQAQRQKSERESK